MNTLAVIKPVSIKLQKKSNDIPKAYNMIAEMEKQLRQIRNNANTIFKAWYANGVALASDLGTKPSVPRTSKIIYCTEINIVKTIEIVTIKSGSLRNEMVKFNLILMFK